MDLRSLILVLASALLALTSYVAGWKFIQKRSYLVGIEILVIAVSATNATVIFATNSEISWAIGHFLDAFTRAFGIPIVVVAGMMSLTHGYKPSVLVDVVALVATLAGTFVLVGVPEVAAVRPYYYVVMWSLFSIYLAYFIKRLLVVGEIFPAVVLGVALVTSQAIAMIYDFYKIPGEETNVVFNFYALALCSWAYLSPALYYACCALERSQKRGMQFTADAALCDLRRTSH